jgi:zinc protease
MPPPLEPRPLNLPQAIQTTLPSGLQILIIEDGRLPIVSIRLSLRSGDINDPADLPGVSDLMTHLLTEGTESRSSREIAEAVERLGAVLNVGSSSDFTTVAASALSIYTDEILDLLVDVTLHPTFPENEVELARENTKQLLIQQRAQPTFLASERMAQVMFGAHPYARVAPTAESLDRMTRKTFIDFRQATFRPNNAVLIVVGDVDRDQIVKRIEALFAGWQRGGSPELTFANPPARSDRRAYIVDRPGSAQSNIVIATDGITRTSKDYFSMLLMHTVLGANASSRLFMNLREHKGYTYGAYSSLDARRLAGTFRATAEVRTPVTGHSLREFFFELNRIRDEAVAEEELQNAKSYLTGVFPIRLETQEGLVDQLVNIKMFDLPEDYLHTYRDRVMEITAEDIQRVARKYLTIDKAAIVIVGDGAEIESQTTPFADQIEWYDTEGKKQKAVGRKQ